MRCFRFSDENKGFFNGDFHHDFKGFFKILNHEGVKNAKFRHQSRARSKRPW
jgi:hypothetical protein